MLFGLYLMFELFLLIGYFAYSYDHITGYTRVRKHPREMHPAEYLSASPFSPFFPLT